MTLWIGTSRQPPVGATSSGTASPARPEDSAACEAPRLGTTVKVAYGLILAASLAAGLFKILAAVGSDPARPDLSDFNVFMLAGQLALAGRLGEAYQLATMLPLEQGLGGGHAVLMPWSYPPLFAFVVAPLAKLPLSLAYLCFVPVTLGVYLAALCRLDRNEAWPILLCGAPAILINIRTGQNGLLTGALFAIAAFHLLERKPVRAGGAIAGLAIKPHLALMLPVLLVLQRRWTSFAVAAIGAASLTGISIVVFGTPVLHAFLASLADVGRIMALGAYPLHRMTSIYACAVSLGVPARDAIVLHGLVALGVLAATMRAVTKTAVPRIAIGLAIMSSVFLSPYFYDYDQTIFAVGLILVAPWLRRQVSPRGYGLMLTGLAGAEAAGIAFDTTGIVLSLGGPVLVALYALMLGLLTAKGDRVPVASRHAPTMIESGA